MCYSVVGITVNDRGQYREKPAEKKQQKTSFPSNQHRLLLNLPQPNFRSEWLLVLTALFLLSLPVRLLQDSIEHLKYPAACHVVVADHDSAGGGPSTS